MRLLPRTFQHSPSLFGSDELFDNFWNSDDQATVFSPKVDVTEMDNSYQISTEIPGVDKKDIQLSLHQGVLTLEAEHDEENKEEKDGKVIRRERRYGKFVRHFDLGSDIQEDDISAQFDKGVLSLTVPKRETPKTDTQHIKIH